MMILIVVAKWMMTMFAIGKRISLKAPIYQVKFGEIKAALTDGIETSIYGSQGEFMSILTCIKQRQSDIFLSLSAQGVRSCSNYQVWLKGLSSRALLQFLIFVNFRLFFKQSLEFAPQPLDYTKTFRNNPGVIRDQNLNIIMPNYDYIVKS